MRQLHPVFNVVKLILATDNPIPSRRRIPPPPPKLVEGEEEYIVEEVLNSRLFCQKIQYLVKWEGYGVKHNTWEYLDHLNNAPDKVAEFYTRHPGMPQQICALTFGTILFHPLSTPPALSQCFSKGVIVRGNPSQSHQRVSKAFEPSSLRHFICLAMSHDVAWCHVTFKVFELLDLETVTLPLS